MFDLISGGPRHPFHDHGTAPVFVLSVVGHAVVLGVVVGLPLMWATDTLPTVPTVMAFVAAEPVPPPPPPPPPPPRAAARKVERAPDAPVPVSQSAFAAPVEAPSEILPEPEGGYDVSAEGGVEGGLVGGVAGGIVGGLVAAPPPPPPPPPPPAPPKAPVRIGGNLQAPALIKRVEPVYPDIAIMARVGGMVILEAVVNAEGKVESVKVLRSVKFLDDAAVTAVRQWEYSPLVLNGVRTPFVLSVMLSFKTEDR